MARVDVVMPKMGESVMEGTVLTWFKKPGDTVEADEALLEIGTDKVDSEIPSPSSGKLAEVLVPEGETVDVGTVLAILETDVDAAVESEQPSESPESAETGTSGENVSSETAASESGEETASEEADGQSVESAPASSSSPASSSTGIQVVMPKMGESVMEGTVLTWFKKPGDDVEEDEALLEIGTDKVDSEIPSPASGKMGEILVPEGETVDVGTVLATISSTSASSGQPSAESEKADTTAAVENGRPTSPERSSAPSPHPGGDGHAVDPGRRGSDGRFYSPLVLSIAREEGISEDDLAGISGSGRDGRVTKKDVLAFVSSRPSDASSQSAAAVAAPARDSDTRAKTAPTVAQPTVVAAAEPEGGGRTEIIEMDRMRQVIAEHMTRSLATSAHVTSFAEADVSNLVTLREQGKAAFLEREGVKLTFTPFFVKAAVDALRSHPLLNSSVEENRIILKRNFDVGIAVAIEKTGLVVPVIRNAGGMNVSGLAHAAADLAVRARKKQLQPDELQGGTFTVTNVGSLGSIMGTPIINQPQVAILATGAIKKRPVVIEHPDLGDLIAIRHMAYLSLSYDHRIIDGAMAASFLRSVVANLEAMGPGYDI